MTNTYIEQIKDIVKSFYNYCSEQEKQIKTNNSYYSSEIAEQRNKELLNERTEKLTQNKQLIKGIFDKVKGFLSCANYLDSASITSDIQILSNPILKPTPEQLAGLVEKYKNSQNYTMLSAIDNFIKQEGINNEGINKYAFIEVPKPKEQLEIYLMFAKDALEMLDRTSVDFKNSDLYVTSFGDENFPPTAELINKIGRGTELAKLQRADIPLSIQHTFDSINLNI